MTPKITTEKDKKKKNNPKKITNKTNTTLKCMLPNTRGEKGPAYCGHFNDTLTKRGSLSLLIHVRVYTWPWSNPLPSHPLASHTYKNSQVRANTTAAFIISFCILFIRLVVVVVVCAFFFSEYGTFACSFQYPDTHTYREAIILMIFLSFPPPPPQTEPR